MLIGNRCMLPSLRSSSSSRRTRAMSSTPPTAPAAAGRGYWTDLEKQQFVNAVIKYGWGKWLEIASCIPTRSKSQVKSHAQKFAIHRNREYKQLLKKHAEEEEKEEEQEGNKQLVVVPTPVKKSFRRTSRTSTAARMAATAKSTATSPVKVRRLSKSSIERADVTPKVATVKTKKPADQATMKPNSGKQIMNMFTKDNTPDTTGSQMDAKVMHSTILPMKDDAIEALDDRTQASTKSHSKDKPGVEMKLEDLIKCKSFDQHEVHVKSCSPDPTAVTPPSFKSSFEESQEEVVEKLIHEIKLDAFEDEFEPINEDSFPLTLENENDIFAILSGVSDIPDQSLTTEQQIRIRNNSFMHLRLQVQPDEHQLEQFTNILESPSEWHESACKYTAMRERILTLARKEEDSGWWRVSPDSLTLDEGVKRAYLERLVALTFAVLQADGWKRSPDVLNAQDDILSICQLFTGIWNRVNWVLARDGYSLFGMGMDHRQRSDAVAQMVRMFDSIPL